MTSPRTFFVGSPYRIAGKLGRVLLAVAPNALVGWTGKTFDVVEVEGKIRRMDATQGVETSAAELARKMGCKVSDLDTLAERHFAPRAEGMLRSERVLGLYGSARKRRARGGDVRGRCGAAVIGKFTPSKRGTG